VERSRRSSGVGFEEQRPGRLVIDGDPRELRGLLEAVLDQQVEVVALVEDLDVDLGMELSQTPYLAVLLGHQLLVERGDLDVQVVGRQIEVGAERLGGLAEAIPFERERAGFVLPDDPVEVEQFGELALGVVREADGLAAGGVA
jgi:hypothetical protein